MRMPLARKGQCPLRMPCPSLQLKQAGHQKPVTGNVVCASSCFNISPWRTFVRSPCWPRHHDVKVAVVGLMLRFKKAADHFEANESSQRKHCSKWQRKLKPLAHTLLQILDKYLLTASPPASALLTNAFSAPTTPNYPEILSGSWKMALTHNNMNIKSARQPNPTKTLSLSSTATTPRYFSKSDLP